MQKTNAMRLLEQAGIPYRAAEYEYDENDLNGRHAADAIGLPYEQVFKTLLTRGSKGFYVFCLPVDGELDLKKAAAAAGEKSVQMLHVKELLPVTGYIRGGCSPIGMKKPFPTFLEETAQLFDEIAVSAGARGLQLILSPQALVDFIKGQWWDLVR